MATLERVHAGRDPIPIELTSSHIAVAFLVERFQKMSPEDLKDIFTLMEDMLNPETSRKERMEIFEAVREILFPESIGEVRMGPLAGVDHVPAKLQKRMDYIGRTIKRLRKAKALTQKDLAKRSGLPQPHISRLERGIHSPSFKSLTKIAKALGVEVGELDPSH
jgi:DNA-binding XRE family transcriptional regulator